MRSINAVVHGAIAHHCGRHPSAIFPGDRLARDLELTPLDLVLVVLEIEDVEEVALPKEELAALETVGDLVCFVSKNVGGTRPGRKLDRVA